MVSHPWGRDTSNRTVFYTDKKVELPEELRELYAMYQQEIHASIYNPRSNTSYRDLYLSKLPPIYTRG